MLYSIIPPEVVLTDSVQPVQELREVELGRGVRLLLRRTAAGDCVERILSTDPRHYLQADLCPGAPYPPLNSLR